MVAVLHLLGALTTLLMVCPTGSSAGSGGILCVDPSIDTIVTLANGETYVFKGALYWEVTDDGLVSGYPRSIFTDWGLPSNLDAAFTWNNGKTYFFKGSNYWRFSSLRQDDGYPRTISQGFSGIPNNIDAAFVWSGNGHTYFFKGGRYWRYIRSQNPHVTSHYPLSISNWNGVPINIDAALKYSNGVTYFFKNGLYWRYNDFYEAVASSYPMSTASMWFGCSE